MTDELWRELLQSSLACSLALILVLLLRKPVRIKLGARIGYAMWLLAPAASLATLLPGPTKNLFLLTELRAKVGLPENQLSAPSVISGPEPLVFFLAIWVLGTLIAMAVFARRQSSFNRSIKRRGDSPFDEAIAHGPAVAGLWKPRIVLPTDFRQRYNLEEQALVLAHEQMHLQRGDIHAQMLATFLRCLFWFNPLVHYAAACFRFDQELACDAAVLQRFPNSRRTYGDAMLKTQLAEFGLPVGCHWQSSHPLKERIAMLKNPLPGALRRTTGLALVAAIVAGGSYGAWAAQPAASAVVNDATASASDPADVTFVPTDSATLPAPPYPKDALAKGVSGSVVLQLKVGVDGHVAEVKVVSSEPAGVFDQAAIAAASKWHINPAVDAHGDKAESWVQVPLTFAADKDGKPAASR